MDCCRRKKRVKKKQRYVYRLERPFVARYD